jgi:3-deoxy-D-manno-octulosonic-acid transferase
MKQLKPNTKYFPCVLFTNTQVTPIGAQVILNPFTDPFKFRNLPQDKTSIIENKNELIMKKLLTLFNSIKNIKFDNLTQLQWDLKDSKLKFI